jgi:hypothetical protein
MNIKFGLILSTILSEQVLLQRYSPLHDMTTQERIKATARRVGLNTPKEIE